jgi:hypothetical protein
MCGRRRAASGRLLWLVGTQRDCWRGFVGNAHTDAIAFASCVMARCGEYTYSRSQVPMVTNADVLFSYLYSHKNSLYQPALADALPMDSFRMDFR